MDRKPLQAMDKRILNCDYVLPVRDSKMQYHRFRECASGLPAFDIRSASVFGTVASNVARGNRGT